MTGLDQHTVTMLGAPILILLSAGMVLYGMAEGRRKGPLWWGLALALGATANLLYAGRGVLHPFLHPILGNLTFAAGSIIVRIGVYRFLDLSVKLAFHAAALVLSTAGFVVFTLAVPSLFLRNLLVGAILTLAFGDIARCIVRAAVGRLRTPYLIVASLFAVCAAYPVVRVVSVAVNVGTGARVETPSLVLETLLGLLFVGCATTVGLISMSTVRLEAEHLLDVERLEEEISRRRLAEERLAIEAATDPLTGVANRRRFQEEARKSMALSRRYDHALSLIMFDLDHFKVVNDSFGHEAGDEVLKAVAQVCLPEVRTEDTFARIGGEEFVLLLPNVNRTSAMMVADRLRRKIADVSVEGFRSPIRLTASFGVAGFRRSDQSTDSILRRADTALFRAKREGRNRVR